MTVCIAAIAAKSKAIVCIADRALTFTGLGANAETDSGLSKIIDIPGTNWCAMFSGDDLTFPARVLAKVSDQLVKVTPSGCGRAEVEIVVKRAFEECWSDEVEDQILKPNLLTKATFTARSPNIQPLDSRHVMLIAEAIAKYEQNCAMLFCGFDANGPHIFKASTPCRIDPCDWQGFQAIGVGEETARNQLVWLEVNKDTPLDETLYEVFSAKVATEVLQTVGYAWNWRVLIGGKKPKPLPKRIDKLIDKAWITHSRSPYSSPVSARERAPKDWQKQLEDFTEELLSGSSKRSHPRKSRGYK